MICNFYKPKSDITGYEASGDVNKKGTKVTSAGIYHRFPGEGDLSCGGSAAFSAE